MLKSLNFEVRKPKKYQSVEENCYRFAPPITAGYSVEGAESVECYSKDFVECETYLTKDKTYYIKISGTAGSSYAIKPIKEYKNITVDRLVNLFDGAYSFTVELAGEYTVMFYCGEHTVSFILYNADGAKIKEYNGGSGEFVLNLAAGEYTFDLAVSEPTSAGVIIKSVN